MFSEDPTRFANWLPKFDWRLLAIVVALGGCSSRLTSTDAQPPQDGPIDLSGLFSSTSCGGTVSFTGTTPQGSFHGDTVNVTASYGWLTQVVVSIGDSQSGWGFDWSYAWAPADGGASLPLVSSSALYGNLLTARNAVTQVSGTVSISAATNPATLADAGTGGQLTATMAFSQAGIDLSGSLSSPYCSVSLDRGHD
jgi:hypothetical protein